MAWTGERLVKSLFPKKVATPKKTKNQHSTKSEGPELINTEYTEYQDYLAGPSLFFFFLFFFKGF
jgi:hypothetical protein